MNCTICDLSKCSMLEQLRWRKSHKVNKIGATVSLCGLRTYGSFLRIWGLLGCGGLVPRVEEPWRPVKSTVSYFEGAA